MSKLVFISWAEDCSRSDNIARQLGGTSFMIYSPFWGSHYATIAFKYIAQAIKTLRVLARQRPRVVLVMTPPPFACLPVWLYGLFTGSPYVIDAHSASFTQARWRAIGFVHRFFSRRARATLVTNAGIEALIRTWGAPVLVVPDVPIRFKDPEPYPVVPGRKITLVCTYAHDEPVGLLVEAARQIPDVHFYITGNVADAPPGLRDNLPGNITLTGFIPRAQYIGLLLASDAVMTMTTRDNTQQRGAYEAIYLGRPVITSDHAFLRGEFPRGAVHAALAAPALAGAIRAFYADEARYGAEARELRDLKLQRWERVSDELRRLVGTA